MTTATKTAPDADSFHSYDCVLEALGDHIADESTIGMGRPGSGGNFEFTAYFEEAEAPDFSRISEFSEENVVKDLDYFNRDVRRATLESIEANKIPTVSGGAFWECKLSFEWSQENE